MDKKLVLGACCGSRMMWFDKQNPLALFMDNRELKTTLCDGRTLTIEPDIIADFREIPFDSGEFKLVVFDPPHLLNAGEKSWIRKKYGKLETTWREDLARGFDECFRVLEKDGILVFKWNEDQIPVREILQLAGRAPLFGHRSGKANKTHWILFMKSEVK